MDSLLQFKRLKAVLALTGISRSSLYLQISRGLWPTPVRITERTVGWPQREIDEILYAKLAGKREGDIRQLVRSIEESRKNREVAGTKVRV